MSGDVGGEMSWTNLSANPRLVPTASVPLIFAGSLEFLKIPVRSNVRISGIIGTHSNVIGEAPGGCAWFVPPVCEEFYAHWAAKQMDGITYVTMCSLAAEACVRS